MVWGLRAECSGFRVLAFRVLGFGGLGQRGLGSSWFWDI